jgi:hypothetical protein
MARLPHLDRVRQTPFSLTLHPRPKKGPDCCAGVRK